ncbi:MAG TPA: sigma-54 dependent transcriptional regulator [Saprospiraceae bacterium]
MRRKLLIVEDEFIVANDLQLILEGHGYKVTGIASSMTEALEMIDNDKPEMVLLDIQLKGRLNGIDLAVKLNEMQIAFVYLSANSNQSILEAAKVTQPYGFLVKPFRTKDILIMLDIAWYRHVHRHDLPPKTSTIHQPYDAFNGIVGEDKCFLEVLDLVTHVAPSDATVLLLGESGTGKEQIANRIHQLSERRTKPFIKINCTTLPANLIESELFGHEKGAFTGAIERRIGKFEQADGGTILLDEIGEMPLEMQTKLLRVLQEKEIERVGGKSPIRVDVRIISSTNRILEKEVADGKFRLDLYYRLQVFPITIPPLRDRPGDIPRLTEHFVNMYSRKFGKPIIGIASTVMEQFLTYSWPGNIRELEHLIARSILLTKGKRIEEMYMLPSLKNTTVTTGSIEEPIKTIEENERDHILFALKKCKGKIWGQGGAAEMLGLPPTTLQSKVKKLGIKKEFS